MGKVVYGIDDGSGRYSLEDCYQFEHFEVGNPMPDFLIPFSPDGAGNHYCFDSRQCNEESCNIIFWQHDLELEINEVEVVNSSFAHWVKEVVIEWTLEDFDYSGNPK